MGSWKTYVLHIRVCFLLVVFVVSAESCKQRDEEVRGNGRAERPFRVALITPGSISDRSWNGGAYAGLLRIRDSLGAEISHIQTKNPAEFDENFRQYGTRGYDIVFGHGFEFQDAAARVAPQFPKTVYIVTSGTTSGRNLGGMVFGFEDAAYLAGILAGSLTKSNMIGLIGGTELPPVRRSFIAFEAGARLVNPRVASVTSYIGNWDDIGAGKEQALAQIARGVDVIFQNADAAGLGVFNAAREASSVYVFGSNSDQNAVAPSVIPASVVIDLPHAFLEVAREVREGRFVGRAIYLGAKSDVVSLIYNPTMRARLPARALTVIDSMRRQIVAGAFEPPRN
ncbi:MAG: BMP family protein [Chloroflexota bacterium]